MKTSLFCITLSLLLYSNQIAYAGGAAAMKKRGAGQQRQRALQQQQMQQQMAIRKAQEEALEKQMSGMADIQVEEIVDFDQIITVLDLSSRAWPLIIDTQAKEIIVAEYIKNFQNKGAMIRKPPLHYANIIDSMSQESPNMLTQPFEQVLQVIAIIEYDFDNGGNKDEMALKVLGSLEAVQQNKARLGIQ